MAVHTVFGDNIKILERLSYTNSVAFVSHSSPIGGGTALLSWLAKRPTLKKKQQARAEELFSW